MHQSGGKSASRAKHFKTLMRPRARKLESRRLGRRLSWAAIVLSGCGFLLAVAPSTTLAQRGQTQDSTDQSSLEQLVGRLASEEEAVRLRAARELGRRGRASAAAVPALIKTLEDPVLEVSLAAAAALGKMGTAAEAAVGPLIERMGKDLYLPGNDLASKYYSQALTAIGPPAIPQLIDATKSENRLTWGGACEALYGLGPQAAAAVPAMREQLREQGAAPQRIWAAVHVLEGVGPAAAPAVEELIPLLQHPDFQVQVVTCRALAAIGPAAKEAIPSLAQLLADGVLSARSQAAMTLGSVGPSEQIDLVQLLLPQTTNFYDVMRDRSLIGLGRLGHAAKAAAPKFAELMRDETYRNRSRAAWAYWKVTGEAKPAVEVLASLSSDLSQGLVAIPALGEMGPEAADAVPALRKVLQGEDPDLQFEAAKTLGKIGPAAAPAIPDLLGLVRELDPVLVQAAKEAIEKIRSAAAN